MTSDSVSLVVASTGLGKTAAIAAIAADELNGNDQLIYTLLKTEYINY